MTSSHRSSISEGGGVGAEAPAGAPTRWSIRLRRSTSSNSAAPAGGRLDELERRGSASSLERTSLLRKVKAKTALRAHRKVRSVLDGEHGSIHKGRSMDFD